MFAADPARGLHLAAEPAQESSAPTPAAVLSPARQAAHVGGPACAMGASTSAGTAAAKTAYISAETPSSSIPNISGTRSAGTAASEAVVE